MAAEDNRMHLLVDDKIGASGLCGDTNGNYGWPINDLGKWASGCDAPKTALRDSVHGPCKECVYEYIRQWLIQNG